MQVKVLPFNLPVMDASGSAERAARSKGVHVSDVIAYIAHRLGQNKYKDGDKETAESYFEMGFIWEEMVELIVTGRAGRGRDHVVKQGEVEKDGIFLTPDALDTLDWVLEEYKATYRGMSNLGKFASEFQPWIWQIKAYCHVLETKVCRLYIWFINGTYGVGGTRRGPDKALLELTFTEIELQANWQMILNNRDAMVKSGWKRPEIGSGKPAPKVNPTFMASQRPKELQEPPIIPFNRPKTLTSDTTTIRPPMTREGMENALEEITTPQETENIEEQLLTPPPYAGYSRDED